MTDAIMCVEDVGEAHIGPYAELSRAQYEGTAVCQPAHLRWKFLANPQGTARGVHLFQDGDLVGRLVAMPRLFEGRDGLIKAAYLVDLVVHPSHRGMGPLLQLARGLNRLRQDFDCVLVTPNPTGLQVVEKFFKLTRRFEMGVSMVPLRPARLATRDAGPPRRWLAALVDNTWRVLGGAAATLARSPDGFTIDTTWPAAAELDELLLAPAAAAEVRGHRSHAFLDWRFRQGPVFKYELAFLRKAGRLVGYLASRRAAYRGYDLRLVVDAFGRPDLTRAEWRAAAWHLVRREAKAGGAEAVMILGNTGCGSLGALAGLPFAAVPPRLVPQPTTVLADWRSSPAFDFSPQTFQLTLADCDMF